MSYRHRVAILNPLHTHDGVLDSMSDDLIVLNISPGFRIEDKYILDVDEKSQLPSSFQLPECISRFRILWRTTGSETVQPLSPGLLVLGSEALLEPAGLKIYAVPDSTFSDQGEFLFQASEFVDKLMGTSIDPKEWILTSTTAKWSLFDVGKVDSKLLNSLYNALRSKDPTIQFDPSYEEVNSLDLVILDSKAYFLAVRDVENNVSMSFTANDDIKSEVGLFLVDQGITTEDDVMFSGVRYVFDPIKGNKKANEGNQLQKTLFHTKPRHRSVPVSYKVDLKNPSGLHPTLEVKFNETEIPTPKAIDLGSSCKLFMYQSLPKSFFLDKYQLPREFSLVASFGDSDLELPAYKIDNWGMETLLEVNTRDNFDFTIHSRYEMPVDSALEDKTRVLIPTPKLFYACDVVEDHEVLGKSPFVIAGDENIGGYQSYFTPDVAFYHFTEDLEVIEIGIPVASGDKHKVELTTYTVVGLGILYVLWKAFCNSQLSKKKKVE